jgi:O-methyltransferase
MAGSGMNVLKSFGSNDGPLRYRFKAVVKNTIRALGFDLRRTAELPMRTPGIRHSEVFPLATYCPWLADKEFNHVYDAVKDNTLVDRYRCYELWQLVAEVAKLYDGDLIEVGVWRGGTGALIAKKAQLAGIRGTAYLCDTFRGVVKAGPLDPTYTGGEHDDTTKEAVLGLCRNLELDCVRILEGTFPEESGGLLADHRFCFCHVDVDVYQSAKDIVEWIWPRLVPGGIIVYDDYGFYTCAGITRFVNEERSKPDRMVIHNLNGHAIVMKIAPASAEK